MQTSQLIVEPMIERISTPFPELVEIHKGLVNRVCRHLLGDSHEAEDAAQATFLILFLRMRSIRETDHVDRWLAGVARRVALRTRRRNMRRAHRERVWAETRDDYITDDDEHRLSEIRRLIRLELARLPERDRQPLVLCYLDGLTHEEAARRLGCPLGTVKARLVRARRKLKDRLSRRGVALSIALLIWLLGWDRAAVLADDRPSDVEPASLARARPATKPRRIGTSGSLSRQLASWPGLAFLPSCRALVGWLVMLVIASALLISAHQIRRNRQLDAIAAREAAKVLDVNCSKPTTSTMIANVH